MLSLVVSLRHLLPVDEKESAEAETAETGRPD